MSPNADTLLAELESLGVRLEVDGDRLRYDAPRGAMTPELLTRLREAKHHLLDALLRYETQPHGGGSRCSVASQEHPVRSPGEPAPRELSFAERVATGYVNPGWTAASWAERLEYLAGRCAEDHPAHAAELRRWAANVRKGAGR